MSGWTREKHGKGKGAKKNPLDAIRGTSVRPLETFYTFFLTSGSKKGLDIRLDVVHFMGYKIARPSKGKPSSERQNYLTSS